VPAAPRTASQNPATIQTALESFLKSARRPALFEPGEELLPITAENFTLEMRGSKLTLCAWEAARQITRRVVALVKADPARVEALVERFAGRQGPLFLVDLDRREGADANRRSVRLVFRERFRLFLRRQFPHWTLAEITSETNLEHSLSPAFPRAFLRHGQHGWAAIAAPPGADAAAALSFGLIWLSYLRAREKRVVVEGLALYVPTGAERAPALRMLCLNPATARFELFTYTEQDYVAANDPRDYGNLDTHLEPCRQPAPPPQAWARLFALPFVEATPKHDGRLSLRVRGMEFAELEGETLRFGLKDRHPASPHNLEEIENLATELARARSAEAPSRDHPLYRQAPEAWLESRVRAEIETIDATLAPTPVYGQTPVFAGGERGIMDLLAVDHTGRLSVLELKASEDLHLPLQALDYWLRVKCHLDRGEFTSAGYFPGVSLRPEPPRLVLVSPSLEFHPSTETLLGYFSPEIEVERIGLAVEWRKGLRVMFRFAGAGGPR
jgi:hypothetical protein